ncbi:cysteine hydrolase family protein [Amycolatopsis sp. CA-230715]|uniref:cysteine hydrolase family protein n=1 Tax=Amycolatopsis sp. CA-230715 TaxID=2745196 RepID=UPI001C011BC9|nr:cysteine hydrolase [Amycolatopsis sp. CA-230715]QWF81543.1 Isochorismatase family protein YecD [Amycolatopsis sp. CA-230715]
MTIDPARTALLAMDFQPAILGSVPGQDALLSRVATAIGTARELGVHIGHVRVAFTDDDHAAIPETNKGFAAAAAGRLLRHDAPEAAVHERLAPRPGDIEVRKTRVGAFSTTDLSRQLAERAVTTLVLAGIHTSGVVLSTVREAADLDFRLYVLSDGCADPRADVHEMLLEAVFPRQADVLSVAELPGLLTAGG